MNPQTVGALLVLVASTGFGTLAIFGKFAARVGLNITSLLTFRFVIGTALLWAVLALWGRAHLLRGLLALAASVVGVALIVGGDVAGIDLVGVVLVLVAALGYAGYITGSRAALASTDADVLVQSGHWQRVPWSG